MSDEYKGTTLTIDISRVDAHSVKIRENTKRQETLSGSEGLLLLLCQQRLQCLVPVATIYDT